MFMSLLPGIKELPQCDGKILKVTQSLYGHRFGAKLFYELLDKHLGTIGFKTSEYDPCLFLGDNCLIVTWVDDMITIAQDGKMVEQVFKKIQGIGFDLEKEGEDGDLAGYLGIDLRKEDDGSIHMTQIGLIEHTRARGGKSKVYPSNKNIGTTFGLTSIPRGIQLPLCGGHAHVPCQLSPS